MEHYTPRNILITGGYGFIGAHFIQHLIAQSSTTHIINYDCLTYAADRRRLSMLNHHRQYTFVQGNICNFTQLKQTIETYHIDTIVHFAAESHVDQSIASPDIFVETNVKGTQWLLEAARQYWQTAFQLSPKQCRFY